MNKKNIEKVKDMVGETIRLNDGITFNADGGEQSGTVIGFSDFIVHVRSARGKRFQLAPEAVFTDRGADRIGKESDIKKE